MRKLLLNIFCGAVTVMAPLSASAITADELCGETGNAPAICVATGDYSWLSLPVIMTGDVTISKISDSKIRISNFAGRFKNVDFTLSGNRLTASAGTSVTGTTSSYNGRIYVGGVGSERHGAVSTGSGYLPAQNWYYNYYDNTATITATISQNNGLINIIFDNPMAIIYNNGNDELFGLVQFQIYEPNTTVSDDLTTLSSGATTHRDYPARFLFDGNGGFTIRNFTRAGQCMSVKQASNTYNYSFSLLGGTYTPVANAEDPTYSLRIAGGTDLLASIAAHPWNLTDGCYLPGSMEVYQQKLGKYVSSSNYSGDLTGTLKLVKPMHNIDEYEHHWVTNDGLRKTYAGAVATFDNYCMWNNSLGGAMQTVKNTVMEIDDKFEVTLDAELNLIGLGVSTKPGFETTGDIRVTGTIDINKNDKFVDHYELWMVPGKFNSVNHPDFIHDPDFGHAKATSLYDSRFDNLTSRATTDSEMKAGETTYAFDKYIKRADINQTADDNQSYSFFIKSVYKDATGLAPTFHSLQYIDSTTSIDEVEASAATVSAGNGVINIAATETTVAEVYNASGVQVYAGTDTEIAVAPGLYIVKIGGKAHKVAVR